MSGRALNEASQPPFIHLSTRKNEPNERMNEWGSERMNEMLLEVHSHPRRETCNNALKNWFARTAWALHSGPATNNNQLVGRYRLHELASLS